MADAPHHSKLLAPFDMQGLPLRNRVVMPAMTRGRAMNAGHVPTPLMATYYAQRASAGLIVAEGTWVSADAIGYTTAPGLYTPEQVAGWRAVTDAVHRRGGTIMAQLWHVGSASHPLLLDGRLPLGPSSVDPKLRVHTSEGGKPTVTPRAMDADDIRTVIADFAAAARNAIEAGFDGVQIQLNFQYLFAQFLHTALNRRSDAYGGPVENRARLLFETLDAVLEATRGRNVGVKVGPSCDEAGMLASNDDTLPTFEHVLRRLNGYDLAHVFIMGTQTDVSATPIAVLAGDATFAYARRFYQGTLVANAEFDLARAERVLSSGLADLVAFGRPYITNPDLVERFRDGVPLTGHREKSFYAIIGDPAEGYVDYPRATLEDARSA